MKKGTTKMAKKTKKDITPKLGILDPKLGILNPKIFYSQENIIKDMLEHAGVKTIEEYNEKMKKEGKENVAKWKTYQNGLFSAVKSILMSSNEPDIERWGKRKFTLLGEKICDVFKDAVKQHIIIDPLVAVNACEEGGIDAFVLLKVRTAKFLTPPHKQDNTLTVFHMDKYGEVSFDTHSNCDWGRPEFSEKIDKDLMKHWTTIIDGLYDNKKPEKAKKAVK